MRRNMVVGFVLGVASIAVIGGVLFYGRVYVPHRSFGSLVRGKDAVTLQDFEIEGQGRRILCKDAEVRRIFGDALRAATPVSEFSLWRAYTLKVRIRPGGSWEATIYVDEQGKSFAIAYWDSWLAEMLTFSDPQHYKVSIADNDSAALRPLGDALCGDRSGTVIVGE
jgi:hypothetical protein